MNVSAHFYPGSNPLRDTLLTRGDYYSSGRVKTDCRSAAGCRAVVTAGPQADGGC